MCSAFNISEHTNDEQSMPYAGHPDEGRSHVNWSHNSLLRDGGDDGETKSGVGTPAGRLRNRVRSPQHRWSPHRVHVFAEGETCAMEPDSFSPRGTAAHVWRV